ncbi:thioredoxin domain-containing protein [Sphingobacterium sp. Mn56C]|uniref:thioredoxin domain-containing protein n=1 Tax=Sphingobacterium sp. Mn56C TaxID=3395261 RepID=UPI003BD7E309
MYALLKHRLLQRRFTVKYSLLLCLFFGIVSAAKAQLKMEAREAYDQLNRNKKIQLLDVRTTEEYTEKHIKNAIHLDWKNQEMFDQGLEKLNKKTPVFVYCLSGGRSQLAAKKLSDAGFSVLEIEGGILKWEAENLPLAVHDNYKNMDNSGMTISDFNAIIGQNNSVLVNFHALWCGPCLELAPTVDSIASAYAGKVKVIKIDIDKNRALVKALKISATPHVQVYKNGRLTWQNTGVIALADLESHL